MPLRCVFDNDTFQVDVDTDAESIEICFSHECSIQPHKLSELVNFLLAGLGSKESDLSNEEVSSFSSLGRRLAD
jgi:hypothetical protein